MGLNTDWTETLVELYVSVDFMLIKLTHRTETSDPVVSFWNSWECQVTVEEAPLGDQLMINYLLNFHSGFVSYCLLLLFNFPTYAGKAQQSILCLVTFSHCLLLQ